MLLDEDVVRAFAVLRQDFKLRTRTRIFANQQRTAGIGSVQMLADQHRARAQSCVGRYREKKSRTECQLFQFRLSCVATRAGYCARKDTAGSATDVSGPAANGVLYVTVWSGGILDVT
jgi:hypothetical protein